MNIIKISVAGNIATVTQKPELTSGMVGLEVEFTLDEYWSQFDEIVATHKGAGWHLDTVITDGKTVVPWECLSEAYDKLKVGIFGATASGEVKTPTIWAVIGEIRPGAVPALESGEEPSRTIVTQLREEIAEKVGEAPEDGKQYARKDGDWVQVQGGGGGSVSWDDIEDKPTSFPPSAHTHDDRYYTEAETDTLLSAKASASDLQTLSGRVTYAESDIAEIDGKIPEQASAQNQLADKGYVDSEVAEKQDTISDLADIRSGAALGATALQEVPNTYRTAAEQDLIDDGKQDIISDITDIRSGAEAGSTAVQPDELQEAVQPKLDSANVSHETWTFTLDDDSTVTKEVVTWNSQT